VIPAPAASLARYTSSGDCLFLAGWSERGNHVPPGTRWPQSPDTLSGIIQQTRSPARVDSYSGAGSEQAHWLHDRGIRSAVGTPITLDGTLWGVLIGGTDGSEQLPSEAEPRLAGLADLVATAISNAAAREALVASRARLVTAGDQARRRIQRDLHDGAQQQLVTLTARLRLLEQSLPADAQSAHEELAKIRADVDAAMKELQEVARGAHPVTLAKGGLPAALKAAAERCPINVELDVDCGRLPEPIELCVNYVVVEALTNAAKHSAAHAISVYVRVDDDILRAVVRDDGRGGAHAGGGSGLVGLSDRVEALGGTLIVASPLGRGTRLAIELPLAAAAVKHEAREEGP
jgi:signal transduction histidine kinase